MILTVPAIEADRWPTLGPELCDWIEAYAVFGPGDLRGQPYVLTPEKKAFLYRLYEVWPKGHERAGRRRFKRGCLSLRKGVAKSEFAAIVAYAELSATAPVRCAGWRGKTPIGGPVDDPFIVCVAYTEEQSDELVYGALKVITEEGPLAKDFDIGLERIMRRGGDGKAVSVATAPNARDGARTTLNIFDETHRLTLPGQKRAHQVMLANVPKRRLGDAWTFEVTTAFAPGEGSIAEATMDYARLVAGGKIKDADLFFFHRQASDKHDLSTDAGARAAVLEASGADAAWSDIDSILASRRDPTTDQTYWERVWTNRPVRSADKAFDITRWQELAMDQDKPEAGKLITLGFDGARTRDSTALVGTDVETGFQWLEGLWERPTNLRVDAVWEVPVHEVDSAVAAAFERWSVFRMYADPFYWESKLAEWAGKYGDDRVVEWRTNRDRIMAYSLRAYRNAISRGELSHSGDVDLARHLGNAVKRPLTYRDESAETEAEKQLWLIQKERPDSPHKIDAAMAADLSWEARMDALTAGAETEAWPAYGAV